VTRNLSALLIRLVTPSFAGAVVIDGIFEALRALQASSEVVSIIKTDIIETACIATGELLMSSALDVTVFMACGVLPVKNKMAVTGVIPGFLFSKTTRTKTTRIVGS
jgi:phosphate/sulfate permease